MESGHARTVARTARRGNGDRNILAQVTMPLVVMNKIYRCLRRCDTSGMTNSQPPDPRVEKAWVNDAGELFVSDGARWLPYEDLPDWPGSDDPDSKALYRDA
jgi:hypothetical protein